MRLSVLINKYVTKVSGALALRAAIVAANFAAMICLAALLGVGPFGSLIYLWSIALVGGTLLSVGGPMLLLRDLTSGQGMTKQRIAVVVLVLPCLLAVLAFVILSVAAPAFARLPVLAAAVAINLSACVASILRARGSVMVSMALRDAGPFVALGAGAVCAIGGSAETALLGGAGILVIFAAVAMGWARCLPAAPTGTAPHTARGDAGAVWGASVVGVAIAQMDLILGGAVFSAEALGVYALLRRIANVVALPVSVATWISAPAVSAAFGAGDVAALRAASAQGNRAAWFPALGLFGLGVIGLVTAGPHFLSDTFVWIFAALLLGALLQAFWASGYTVATLTDAPALSLVARLIVLAGYGLMALWHGEGLSPLTNALAYVVAMSAGSLWLWLALWRRFGVDTSAASLWVKGVPLWRTS
jgi:O-antigen/teichoic acid export membrane protein